MSLDLRVFNLFFFASFDHTTIVNLVSNLRAVLLVSFTIFNGHVRDSILFNSRSFALNFWKIINMQF